jgi:hypothetical protein
MKKVTRATPESATRAIFQLETDELTFRETKQSLPNAIIFPCLSFRIAEYGIPQPLLVNKLLLLRHWVAADSNYLAARILVSLAVRERITE